MRNRRSHKYETWKMRRENDRRRMAVAAACFRPANDGDFHHVPDLLKAPKISTNLWQAHCLYCKAIIFKRADDAALFDPWVTGMSTIVEWP